MKIMLPVDGSPHALAAVRHALAVRAAGLRASYVLVNVQAPPSLYEMVVTHDTQALDELRAGAGSDLLQPAEALLSAAGAEFESEVAGGDAQTTLLDALENYGCDAVIMGVRGMADAEGSGPGEVALSLLRHATVPVTLVRERAEPADADRFEEITDAVGLTP